MLRLAIEIALGRMRLLVTMAFEAPAAGFELPEIVRESEEHEHLLDFAHCAAF